jgi:hypothetical protein
MTNNPKDEQWKQCLRFSAYEVSSRGNIRKRNTKRMLQPWIHTKGYPYITLRKLGKRKDLAVHTLVLRAFVGKRPTSAHQCAHADGNPQNNRVSNLRWATPGDNCKDRDAHGRTARGSKNGGAKLTESQVVAMRGFKGSLSTAQMAGIAGVCERTVHRVLSGDTWKETA